METVEINLFYPLLFTVIGLFIIVSGVVIFKCKDSNLFNNIFNRHVDEHIDTTDKFSKAHTEVIDHLPPVYEKELHSLEKNNKKILEMLENINGKLDILIEYSTGNKK